MGSPETKLSTLVSTMREEKCIEKMIEDTRSAFMILSRLKSTTDPDAMDELSVLSIAALEKAMWLLKTQQSTVDIMRGQQDAVTKQVLEVKMVMQGLLKARQRVEEARKKIAKTDNEDEQVAAAMAASRPVQFATATPVCQEDVFQRSAFDILQASVMDGNLTDEEAICLRIGWNVVDN